MAFQAYGNQIIARLVTKETSQDSTKDAVYKGTVYSVGPLITTVSAGDDIYFKDDGTVTSIWHDGTSQNLYFLDESALTAYNDT